MSRAKTTAKTVPPRTPSHVLLPRLQEMDRPSRPGSVAVDRGETGRHHPDTKHVMILGRIVREPQIEEELTQRRDDPHRPLPGERLRVDHPAPPRGSRFAPGAHAPPRSQGQRTGQPRASLLASHAERAHATASARSGPWTDRAGRGHHQPRGAGPRAPARARGGGRASDRRAPGTRATGAPARTTGSPTACTGRLMGA